MKQTVRRLEKNLKSARTPSTTTPKRPRQHPDGGSAASSILAVRDANVAAGMKVEDANPFTSNRSTHCRGAVKAGFTRQRSKRWWVRTRRSGGVGPTITTNGLNSALDNASRCTTRWYGNHGHYYTATIHVVRTGASATAFASGGIRRAATGLIVGPSDPGP